MGRTPRGQIDRRPARAAGRRAGRDGAPSASPVPSQGSQRSDQTSPRPPHARHTLRTGTSSGTVTPSNASRGERCSSADSRRRRLVVARRRDEAFAHPFDRRVQRRKIDRHFVGEPRGAARDRHRKHAPGRAPVVTRANRVVPHRLSRYVSITSFERWSRKNVPMCGERCGCTRANRPIACPALRETRTKPVREWICPECDHFEDAEES